VKKISALVVAIEEGDIDPEKAIHFAEDPDNFKTPLSKSKAKRAKG